MLGEAKDPLQLRGFFPCPIPLAANLTTGAFVPKSDYEMLRDQYVELNVLQNRIALLEDAIKVVGAYDKTASALGVMLNGTENAMIPVDQWAMFAEKGGIKGAVDWFPIDMVVQALEKLYVAKTRLVEDLRQLRGISDLMRGNTAASETATAQGPKAQFGSARMQPMQSPFAIFVQQHGVGVSAGYPALPFSAK